VNKDVVDQHLISTGRDLAERILIDNGSELGLLGSSQAYKQVWARDSMISGLGLLLCQDTEGHAAHRSMTLTASRLDRQWLPSSIPASHRQPLKK
jgi:glycogen debranching enzyme